jgi:hypothetical protein
MVCIKLFVHHRQQQCSLVQHKRVKASSNEATAIYSSHTISRSQQLETATGSSTAADNFFHQAKINSKQSKDATYLDDAMEYKRTLFGLPFFGLVPGGSTP